MSSSIWLLLSLFALLIGPVLYTVARGRSVAISIVEGFVVVAASGVVLIHVLPECLEAAGSLALLPAACGVLLPAALERFRLTDSMKTHHGAMLIASSALIVHASVDGMALTGSGNPALPLAVILHRLPVGLTLWWLLRPNYGRVWAVGGLGLVALGTVAGFWVGGAALDHLRGPALASFQAFVSGTLLHVLFHPHRESEEREKWNLAEGAGALAAVGLLVFLPFGRGGPHAEHVGSLEPFFRDLMQLSLEAAPPLLLGFFVAGPLAVFLPGRAVDGTRRGGVMGQSLRGVALGLPLPVCSRGVIPLYRSLIGRGVPVTAAVAFLIAAPELGVGSFLLSLSVLGPSLTLARVVCVVLTAMLVGWLVGRSAGKAETGGAAKDSPKDDPGEGIPKRLSEAMRLGFGKIVDQTAPWIVAGLSIAALVGRADLESWLQKLPGALEVPLFALVGLPLYVCAAGATPLAAALLANGISPGAAVAFLLTGAATSTTTYGLVSRLHGPRSALHLGVALVLVTIALGFGVNFLLAGACVPALLGKEELEHGWIQKLCLAALAVVFSLSILRLGPRAWLNHVFSGQGGDAQWGRGEKKAL